MKTRIPLALAATLTILCATPALAQPPASVEIIGVSSGAVIQSRVPSFAVRVQPPPPSDSWGTPSGLAVRLDGRLLVECRGIQMGYGGEHVFGDQVVRFFGMAGEAPLVLAPNQQVASVPLGSDWSGRCGLTPAEYRQAPPPALGMLTPGRHTLEVFVMPPASATPAASASLDFTYAPAPPVIVYENAVHRAEIFGGTGGEPGIGPGVGGPAVEQYTAIPPANSFTRLGRVNGRTMIPMTARAMASFLERAVNRSCDLIRMKREKNSYCMGLPEIAVDEITPDFRDWSSAEVRAKGKTSPGARLSEALRILAGKQAPWGEPYSNAVNLYVAGEVASGIAGRGSARYTALRGALRATGGVLLEMYSGSPGAGAKSFSGADWQAIPAAVVRLSGTRSNVHFVMTSATGVPARGGCTGPMACQWAWAESTATNRAILQNRPATYRTGDQAGEWLRQYNARFSR